MPEEPLTNDVGELLCDLGFKAYWPSDPIEISSFETNITTSSELIYKI